ncbi:MAG: polysaccharide deacetylase [Candidatus Tectimicrobiota bacterium]|nr:MAG: polysaccharide deacetylase [Candidatus Tectomicrobia bacterium]
MPQEPHAAAAGMVEGALAGLGPDASWRWPEARWRQAVQKVRAGRSLKPAFWPAGAQVAVALSFDVDQETLTLRDGKTSPALLAQGEYGSRAGLPRILALLEQHGIPASFYIPGVSALLHPDDVHRIADAGHEIGLHGWIHERNSNLAEEDERALTLRAAEVLEKLAGKPAVGLRTPSWDFSAATLKIIRELGLLYDSSLMGDDEPYELLEDGEPTGVVELPVEWIKDDYPYFGMDRLSAIRPYTPPSLVFEIWRREFDGAYAERGLFLLTMHPHIIGHRSRISVLAELIAYIRSHPGVWFATHEQVARYVKAQAALA